MKVVVGLASLEAPAAGSVVTVGTFDGVHVGHRALMARAAELAGRSGASAVALTWDRHPAATLRPDKVPPLLSSPERKVELISGLDLDLLAVLPFDRELSHWPPERFVADVLVAGLNATAVVVGRDWRFGHKAAGDTILLAELGRTHGFAVEPAELVEVAGEPASSSRVRRAIGEGRVELATTLLGRPFDLDGVVVHGDDRGASLGYPTANVAIDPALAHPPRGVYAGRARVEGSWFKAAINLGVNPTFGGDAGTDAPRIEAYLLGFDGDLYTKTLRIEFHARLRDELRFDGVEALVAQIARDVEATDRLIAP